MYLRLARHARSQIPRINAIQRLPSTSRLLSASRSCASSFLPPASFVLKAELPIFQFTVQDSSPPFSEPAFKDPSQTTYKQSTPELHTYGSYIMSCLPKFIQQFSVVRDELTLYVAPSALLPTLNFLRDHTNCQFKQLVDISGADYPTRDKRFEVVYHLLSVQYNSRIRVKTYADETSSVPSATSVFNSANW